MNLTIQTNNYIIKIIILREINTTIQKNKYNIQIQEELNKLYVGNYVMEELSIGKLIEERVSPILRFYQVNSVE